MKNLTIGYSPCPNDTFIPVFLDERSVSQVHVANLIINRIVRIRYETTYEANRKWRLMMKDQWLSVDNIAAYLGMKRDAVYRWISKRNMPGYKIGRLWKFQKKEIHECVKSGGADDTKG